MRVLFCAAGRRLNASILACLAAARNGLRGLAYRLFRHGAKKLAADRSIAPQYRRAARWLGPIVLSSPERMRRLAK
jgi:hypothetical protein